MGATRAKLRKGWLEKVKTPVETHICKQVWAQQEKISLWGVHLLATLKKEELLLNKKTHFWKGTTCWEVFQGIITQKFERKAAARHPEIDFSLAKNEGWKMAETVD